MPARTGPACCARPDGRTRAGRPGGREKRLSNFDFDVNLAIKPTTIHTLVRQDWIKKGEPLCLIGNSGTGKTDPLSRTYLIRVGCRAGLADLARPGPTEVVPGRGLEVAAPT